MGGDVVFSPHFQLREAVRSVPSGGNKPPGKTQCPRTLLFGNWDATIKFECPSLLLLTKDELEPVRLSAQRGRPLGDEGWVEAIARRLNLESTMRPRGSQRIRSLPEDTTKEA